jgi:hypothetical protein
VVAAVEQKKHDRSRAEIERNAIAHMKAWRTVDPQSEAPFLDVSHPNQCADIVAFHHNCVTVEPIICYDRSQFVHVDNMVDLRPGGRLRHVQISASCQSDSISLQISEGASVRSANQEREALPVTAWCDLVCRWKPLFWAKERGQIITGIGPSPQRRAIEGKAYTAREQFASRCPVDGGRECSGSVIFQFAVNARCVAIKAPISSSWIKIPPSAK